MNQANQDKKIRLRSVIFLFAAYALGLGTNILGITFANIVAPDKVRILFWICILLPLVFAGLSVGLRILYIRNLQNKSVRDMQRFLISHRDEAGKTAAEKLRLLLKLCNFTLIYTLLFPLMAFGCGFLGQAVTGANTAWDVPLTFMSGFLYLCAIHRIHFTAAAPSAMQDPLMAKREEYPQIYELAEECARSQGWSGRIAIRFSDGCNAGIHRSGNTCSIYLGVLLLNLLTKEELKAVFCHEFNHIIQEKRSINRIRSHFEWLGGGATPHFLSGLVNLFYELPDAVFTLEFQLYRYANAIDMENTADQAMITMVSGENAASMLMKLKFHSLFQWEEGTFDTLNDYASEQPDENYLTTQLQLLKQRMLEREPIWRELFYKEILARSATHPTAAMRLESLGVRELPKIRFPEQDDYRAECQKAMAFMAETVCKELESNYSEARQEAYLTPLKIVGAWEAAGKPVIPEQYADVDDALRILGRYTEAEALCKEAMETLPAAAGCYGTFMHGCFLLRTYDDAGIDLIYAAIERNHNYLDEGLSMLGEYCCLTGNGPALETYREKAVAMTQVARDVYAHMNDLKKGDRLVPEELPGELHDSLLNYLERVDEGQIDRVYLVRKVINQENFTSAVIVRFQPGAAEESCNQMMDKLFHFLDTCSDWQFSLFDYARVAKAQPEKVENSCIYIHKENADA